MSEHEELLPCPFCGCEKIAIEEDSKMWTGQRTVVLSWKIQHRCIPDEQDVTAPRLTRFMLSMHSVDADVLARAWNRRS